ncbi:Nn.00g011190.m01.CDS01 [Neocucurbitaria sp. VM-36]
MITPQDLTVGQVSGMIAAAVFVDQVQFVVPIALPVILLGLLRPQSAAVTETAVSWSVIGRFLHNSLWPLFLRTDSAATLSACKSALFMSFFKTFMLVLIAVAAVVTPLGLYEGIVAEPTSTAAVFHYIKDTTPMGYGTAPRDLNNTWSRLCGSFLLVPCPNDNNEATVVDNSSMISVDYKNEWYSSEVPKKVVDVFQSGLVNSAESLSSIFDIQYRSYVQSEIDDKTNGPVIDNGTARTIGNYQPLSSLVLNDAIIPVEGLIVDMKNGGIGFRNHSAPTLKQYGSTWSEDILFVVPETVCVDTNLTLDFLIPRTRSEGLKASSGVYRPSLTDRGGFVHLNKTYPRWNIGDVQENPELWYRAYRAAWLSNAYSMAFMNVTNLSNETTGVKAFAYLNSEMNKTFPLYYPDNETVSGGISISPQMLSISTLFGKHLDGTEGMSNVSTSGNQTTEYNFESKLPIYTNPFGINSTEWSSIDTLCRGQGGGDLANITHMVAKCGVLNGAPVRNDGSASLMFDPGTAWSVSMYTCMSTAKATIKTASFRFNGTNDDLTGLEVVSLVDKTYPTEESKPFWGVENTEMFLKDGNPLWGLISEEQAKTLNLSTLRKERLYLPGRDGVMGWQNLPGADFASIALDMAYDFSLSTKGIDYSGQSNLALFRKWQELSRSPDTSAKILNLIWTDIAANMVVGTKSLTPPETKRKRDDAPGNASTPPTVTSYSKRVKYRYAYGIPAFLALVLLATCFTSTIFFVFFSGAKPSTMRTFLQHTSAGRFLTSHSGSAVYAQPHTGSRGYSPPGESDGYSDTPTQVWIKGAGLRRFTLGGEGWTKNVQEVPGYETKGGATANYTPVPNPQGY